MKDAIIWNTGSTLFLDRDGVINRRLIGDYVKTVNEFEFLNGAIEAIQILTKMYTRIVVVTNQQGIGKGIMSVSDLEAIHQFMLSEVEKAGGRIEQVYFCPELAQNQAECRKPNTGMGMQAKREFPDIEFGTSVMVGDSISDMEFGDRLGMQCAFIGQDEHQHCFESLIHFARVITSQ